MLQKVLKKISENYFIWLLFYTSYCVVSEDLEYIQSMYYTVDAVFYSM